MEHAAQAAEGLLGRRQGVVPDKAGVDTENLPAVYEQSALDLHLVDVGTGAEKTSRARR
jgi:hypothetical protein